MVGKYGGEVWRGSMVDFEEVLCRSMETKKPTKNKDFILYGCYYQHQLTLVALDIQNYVKPWGQICPTIKKFEEKNG